MHINISLRPKQSACDLNRSVETSRSKVRNVAVNFINPHVLKPTYGITHNKGPPSMNHTSPNPSYNSILEYKKRFVEGKPS
jgi:hypothetical protein